MNKLLNITDDDTFREYGKGRQFTHLLMDPQKSALTMTKENKRVLLSLSGPMEQLGKGIR